MPLKEKTFISLCEKAKFNILFLLGLPSPLLHMENRKHLQSLFPKSLYYPQEPTSWFRLATLLILRKGEF